LVIIILLENDYPLDFIFGTINDRIQYHLKKKKIGLQGSSNIDNLTEWTAWFMVRLSFVPSITEKFNRFNNKDKKVSFYSTNKFKKFSKA